MKDPVNIIFLLGLSGAGKTTLGETIARNYNWLHLDLDPDEGDGLEKHGLIDEWTKLKAEAKAEPLIEKITSAYKADNKTGAVLSFPSTRRVEASAIERVKKDIKIVYLSGSKKNCLTAFHKREKTSSRNLDEDHWIKFNNEMLTFLSNPKLKPYKIEVFKVSGKHRPAEELLRELNL